jgi:hypothetical protein
LLTHEIHIEANTTVGLDATSFVKSFRQIREAIEQLGNDPNDLPRRQRMKVIEHDEGEGNE